jgi:hypothetical protein
LSAKDLGPQISWTTVFLVEYVSLFSGSMDVMGWLIAVCNAGWTTAYPPAGVQFPAVILLQASGT